MKIRYYTYTFNEILYLIKYFCLKNEKSEIFHCTQ